MDKRLLNPSKATRPADPAPCDQAVAASHQNIEHVRCVASSLELHDVTSWSKPVGRGSEMAKMTNIERLEEADVLDSSDMSEKHKNIVNNEMTQEEILGIMVAHRAKSRLNSDPWKPDSDAAFF
jgi:hypothetical protein